MTEKERYATIGTWVEVFRKEGVQVSESFVRNRLKIARVIGMTGRENRGRPLLHGFFSEPDVRKVLADILDPDLLHEQDDGYAYKNGIKYINLNKFITVHTASYDILQTLVETAKLEPVKGRSKTRITDYYPKEDLLKLWQDYLKLPCADANGLIEIDGEQYYTVYALSGLFTVSEYLIKSIFPDDDSGIRGRDEHNIERVFYPVGKVRDRLKKMKDMPRVDEKGFALIDGTKMASIGTWCDCLSIEVDVRTIKKCLDKLDIAGVSALDQSGVVREGLLYSEAEFRKAIDKHQRAAQLNENGETLVEGKKYMTVSAFCAQNESSEISEITLRRRLKKLGIWGLKARNELGQPVNLYTEEDLINCVKDQLNPLGTAYFQSSEKIRADLAAFAAQLGENMNFIDLRPSDIRALTIVCQNGCAIRGQAYLHHAARVLGLAKDQEEARCMTTLTLRQLIKCAGCELLDKDYFENPANVSADLNAFACQLGEGKTSADLSTGNIASVTIICKNGQSVKGETYLKTAARALGLADNDREAKSSISKVLQMLKCRTGYLTQSNV